MEACRVHARLTCEVQAHTAGEALRLVSLDVHDDEAVSVEYSIWERPQESAAQERPMDPKEPQPSDLHGLTKPVYTVSEVASILGASKYSVYDLVRRGLVCIRLGRKVLIPWSTIVALLNGEIRQNEREAPAPFRSKMPRRGYRKPKGSTVTEVVAPVRLRQPRQELKEKPSLSVTEAARILHISTSRLRELLDQRKIYYRSITVTARFRKRRLRTSSTACRQWRCWRRTSLATEQTVHLMTTRREL
jgi:excisionase family DNA binding protein